MTRSRHSRFAGALVATCFLLTACGTGPERGTIQVVMTAEGAASASVAPNISLSSAPGDVAIESIESILLPIVRIDLKPESVADEDAGEGESSSQESGDEDGWVRLDVPAGTTVDLLALPQSGGEEIGAGEVVATTYKEIRLVCGSTATITLAEVVTVSGGVMIGDDEPLEQPLRIPSCESSGLKIKGGTFVVPADGEGIATIELSTLATVHTVDWISSQGFQIGPVMKIPN